MLKYPSTTNLLERDPDTHKCTTVFRRDDFEQVSHWLVTEKVDGTNIRVLMQLKPEEEWVSNVDTVSVEVRGRTDGASVPQDLEKVILDSLQANYEAYFQFMHDLTGGDTGIVVCLYGEGYGAGIQKVGRQYRPDKSLRLFDVTTTRFEDGVASTRWRSWETVQAAADATGLKTVPVLAEGMTTAEVVDLVSCDDFYSYTALDDSENGSLVAEGVVARTDPYLYTWRGERVMFKLKGCDLA